MNNKIVRFWAPVFVWAGVIFYFSSVPHLESGLPYDFILRKAAHVTEYLILTFLLYRAFKNTFILSAFALFTYPTGLALLYAVSDELHQFFVSGRSCSAADVCIDALGILGFYLIVVKSRKW